MTVSIVMATYKRPKQLERTLASITRQQYPGLETIVVEDGNNFDETPIFCHLYDAKYICRKNRPAVPFSNQAIPLNIGIRAAKGSVLILQNPECEHQGDVIEILTSILRPGTAAFASVSARNELENHTCWHVHPNHSPRPFFFCGAIHREILLRLRGFDEDYLYAGWEDNDLAARLERNGMDFIFSEKAVVHHQHHGYSEDALMLGEQAKYNERLYEEKMLRMTSGEIGTVRNLGREWGRQ